MPTDLATRLRGVRRVVVVGGPGTGKTTLAQGLSQALGVPVRSTDSTIGWSESSLRAARWMAGDGVVEGVAAVRALRKSLDAGGPLPDVVVHLREPQDRRTPGQERMARGHDTIWAEVAPRLRRRGVQVNRGVEH